MRLCQAAGAAVAGLCLNCEAIHTHKVTSDLDSSCEGCPCYYVNHAPTLLCISTQRIVSLRTQSDDGFEFFIRKYETLLGRRSSSAQADVVLGDNMNTSRKHASITYNFEKGTALRKQSMTADVCQLHCRIVAVRTGPSSCPALARSYSRSRADSALKPLITGLHQLPCHNIFADCSALCSSVSCPGVFELTVLGKNGVSIDGVLFTPNSSPAPLASRVRSCRHPIVITAGQ